MTCRRNVFQIEHHFRLFDRPVLEVYGNTNKASSKQCIHSVSPVTKALPVAKEDLNQLTVSTDPPAYMALV